MYKTFISIILLSVLLIGCNDNSSTIEALEEQIDYLTQREAQLLERIEDLESKN